EPLRQIQDVLLSGTKIVYEQTRNLAQEIGFALGQSDLSIVHGGLRSENGREYALDYLIVTAMEKRLVERRIALKERILTILPAHLLKSPKQEYFEAGTA